MVDDETVNRLLLAALLREHGHTIIEAENGREAVERFTEHAPDLVFMDVLMPEMDGYEAASRIKQLAGERYVPLIFITSLTDDAGLARCLESGGDDFLTKPFNRVILLAKLEAALRARALNETIRHQRDELVYHQERLRQEHQLAERVFSRMVRPGCDSCESIRYLSRPTSIFNGDFILVSRAPRGRLHLLMGDFTGHGLSAAIGTLPVSQQFYSLSRRGVPLASMVVELNRLLHQMMPVGMFLAAALIEYDATRQRLTVWNGGLPDLLLRGDHGVVRRFVSHNLALGVLPQMSPESAAGESCDVEVGMRLYACSDGVTELGSPNGEPFGEERLMAALEQPPAEGQTPFDTIHAALRQHIGGSEPHDDVTLLELTCLLPAGNEAEAEAVVTGGEVLEWQWTVEFDAPFLRISDPVAPLVETLAALPDLAEHRERIYVIIAELFNNAIDHGLLGLDSQVKGSPEGFDEYYRLREQALARLQQGMLECSLSYRQYQHGGRLHVVVTDSGPGYHHDGSGRPVESSSHKLYAGMGLGMVRSLCSEVNFSAQGNRVEAIYEWE